MADRRIRRSDALELRPLLRLGPLWLAGAALVAAITTLSGIPSEQVLLDPATSGGLPWYQGLVSNLGVLGWAAAAAVAGVGSRWARAWDRDDTARLLLGGALLSALLTLDDLFQLHSLAGHHLGIPKSVIYGGYAVLLAIWLLSGRRALLRTPVPLLVAAVSALACSALIDRTGWPLTASLVAEDGAKFLGILAWASYFVDSAVTAVRPTTTTARTTPAP